MATFPTISGLVSRATASSLAQANDTPVTSWSDSAATATPFAEATSAFQPRFRTSVAALGGKPAISFDGVDDRLAATRPETTTPSTVFFVCVPRVKTTSSQPLFARKAASDFEMYAEPNLGGYITGGGAFVNVTTTTPHVLDVGAVYTLHGGGGSTNNKLFVNGSLKGSAAEAATGNYSGTVHLGLNAGSMTRFFQGEVAEVIAYNRILTDAERASVHGYIRDEYGIASADAPPPVLPKIGTVVDAFTSDSGRWVLGSSGSIADGTLNIAASTSYPTVSLSAAHDLTASQVSIELVEQLPQPSGETYLTVSKWGDNTDRVEFITSGGLIYCRHVVAGVRSADTTFTAATTRFFRFREAAGTLYFETSVDGTAWTVRRSIPTPAWSNNILCGVMAGYYTATDTAGGRARWDNLNGTVSAAAAGPTILHWGGTAWVRRKFQSWSGSAWTWTTTTAQEFQGSAMPAEITAYGLDGTAAPTHDPNSGNPAPSLFSDGFKRGWYFNSARWQINGDFDVTYDVLFPNSTRDIANFAFWANTANGRIANGFMFRLDSGDGSYFFSKVTNEAHTGPGVGTETVTVNDTLAIAKDVWHRTRITATGNLVRAVVTNLTSNVVVRDVTIDVTSLLDASHPRSGTFGQKPDAAASVAGHRWDNIRLLSGAVSAPSVLPARIVQGYFPGYAAMRLKDSHSNYNLIMWSFVIGVGNTDPGAVQMGYVDVQNTPATIAGDIDLLQAAGKVVIASIGGASDLGSTFGYLLQTTAHVDRFMATVVPIIDQYGFQGIDWDLEHADNFTAAAVIDATKRLKLRYGTQFIVGAAPYGLANSGTSHPADSGGEIPLVQKYRDIINGLAASEFDLLSVQFYNNGDNTVAAIKSTTAAFLTSTGLPDSKMVFGFMSSPQHPVTAGGVTPEFVKSLWDSWRADGRDARGIMLWEINLDRIDSPSYRWAVTAGSHILATSTAPAAPPALPTGATYRWRAASQTGADGTQIATLPNEGSSTVTLGQANAALQPTLQTVDGQRVFRFDGIDDRLLNTSGTLSMPLECTHIAILRPNTGTTFGQPFGGAQEVYWDSAGHGMYAGGVGIQKAGVPVRGTKQVWVARFGAAAKFTIDGTQVATGTFIQAEVTAGNVVLGNHADPAVSRPFPGDIYEYVIYPRQLTDAEVAQVQAYATNAVTTTGAVRTTSASPVRRAQEVVNIYGVATHMAYDDGNYANRASVTTALDYLGVKNIRDGWGTGRQVIADWVISDLRPRGINLCMVHDSRDWPAGHTATQMLAQHKTYGILPDIKFAEGSNELDLSNNIESARTQALAHLAAYKSDPAAAHVIRCGPSLADTNDDAKYQSLGVLADVQAATFHDYPGVDRMMNDTILNTLGRNARHVLPTASGTPVPVVSTETGFSSGTTGDAGKNMPDVHRARQEVRIWLEHALGVGSGQFAQDCLLSVNYELVDQETTAAPSVDTEFKFGLFTKDWQPKPPADVLKRTIALLSDTAPAALTFTPSPPVHTRTGGNAATRTLVMQKADGSWWLAVWQQVQTWDGTSDVTPFGVSITITVPVAKTATLYSPIDNVAEVAFSSATTFTFDSHAMVKILRIAP